MLRIRDVYPGSDFFPSRIRTVSIPDPGSSSKKLRILNKWFLSSKKYDPGCSSRIRMLTFYPSRIQGSKRHPIPNPGSGSATLVQFTWTRNRNQQLNLMRIQNNIRTFCFLRIQSFKAHSSYIPKKKRVK